MDIWDIIGILALILLNIVCFAINMRLENKIEYAKGVEKVLSDTNNELKQHISEQNKIIEELIKDKKNEQKN